MLITTPMNLLIEKRAGSLRIHMNRSSADCSRIKTSVSDDGGHAEIVLMHSSKSTKDIQKSFVSN